VFFKKERVNYMSTWRKEIERFKFVVITSYMHSKHYIQENKDKLIRKYAQHSKHMKTLQCKKNNCNIPRYTHTHT
jgi:hypothetical protein